MPNDTIRPYGPGKFSTILDSYVYDVSLNGMTDDECGSVDENGEWFGLMKNGLSIFKDHDPLLETLNESEQEKLTSCAGVILREDSSGFVTVDYFDTIQERDEEWKAISDRINTETNEDD
jgi:hypothetical protein